LGGGMRRPEADRRVQDIMARAAKSIKFNMLQFMDEYKTTIKKLAV